MRYGPALLLTIALLLGPTGCGGDEYPADPPLDVNVNDVGEPVVHADAELEAPTRPTPPGPGDPVTAAARYPARDFIAAFESAGVERQLLLVRKVRAVANRKAGFVTVSWRIKIGSITARQLERALVELGRQSLRYRPLSIELMREGTGIAATVELGHRVEGVSTSGWKELPPLTEGLPRSALEIWRELSAIVGKVRDTGTTIRLIEFKLSSLSAELSGLIADRGKLDDVKGGLLALDYVNDLGPLKSYLDPDTQKIRFRMSVPFTR
jgi:hypothetical protein